VVQHLLVNVGPLTPRSHAPTVRASLEQWLPLSGLQFTFVHGITLTPCCRSVPNLLLGCCTRVELMREGLRWCLLGHPSGGDSLWLVVGWFSGQD
jgi:hypothetical protein